MKCFVKPVISDASRNATKGLTDICKQYQESIQQL